MTQYNDTSGLSQQIRDLYQQIRQLQTQPRLTSSSIDRGGTQSSDYDGSSIDVPGTRGWKIGTDETTGEGYVHINGYRGIDLLRPRRVAAPYIPVTLNAPFTNYGLEHHKAGYLKTSAGIVCLSGLILAGSITNSVIFTLPEGYRPEVKMMFPAMLGGSTTRLTVFPNGDVQVNASAATYVSLSGIMFPANGVGTWTTITDWQTNWVDYYATDPSWGQAAYMRDSLGRVWFRGLARYVPGGTIASDSNMFIVPYEKAGGTSHFPGFGTDAFSSQHALRVGPGQTYVAAKTGTVATWVSFTKCVFVDTAVRNDWFIDDFYFNSWTHYGSPFPQPQYMLFSDGIVFRDGLIKNGTVSTGATGIAQNSIPGLSADHGWRQSSTSGKELFLGAANNAYVRIDVLNSNYTEGPRVQAVVGSNVWLSYGGVNYVVGY